MLLLIFLLILLQAPVFSLEVSANTSGTGELQHPFLVITKDAAVEVSAPGIIAGKNLDITGSSPFLLVFGNTASIKGNFSSIAVFGESCLLQGNYTDATLFCKYVNFKGVAKKLEVHAKTGIIAGSIGVLSIPEDTKVKVGAAVKEKILISKGEKGKENRGEKKTKPFDLLLGFGKAVLGLFLLGFAVVEGLKVTGRITTTGILLALLIPLLPLIAMLLYPLTGMRPLLFAIFLFLGLLPLGPAVTAAVLGLKVAGSLNIGERWVQILLGAIIYRMITSLPGIGPVVSVLSFFYGSAVVFTALLEGVQS